MEKFLGFKSILLNGLNSSTLGFRSWQDNLVDSFARLIWSFLTTNIEVKIILLTLNIPLYFVLGKVIFKDWNRFWRIFRGNILVNILGPFLFIFKWKAYEKQWLNRSEIWLVVALNLMWIVACIGEYLLIKTFYL